VTLTEYMKKAGLDFVPALDGKIHRFGDNDNEWYAGRPKRVTFGDWSTGKQKTWTSDVMLTLQELQECKNDDVTREKEREAGHEEAAEKAHKMFNVYAELGTHQYLIDKGFPSIGRDQIDKWGALLVPINNKEGKLVNLQRILPDGEKRFLKGGERVGCYTEIWNESIDMSGKTKPKKIYICEGYSTGMSISGAMGSTGPNIVVVAFNTTNLLAVGKNIREKYKDAGIVFCADNDQWKTPKPGMPKNPGIHWAQEASEEIPGSSFCYPRFKPEKSEGKPTDYNDLHQIEGLEEVRLQILNIDENHPEPGPDDLTPLRPRAVTDAKGKVKYVPPSQQEVANALLEHLDGNVMSKNEDLFRYTGTHWEHMELREINQLKQGIQTLLNGLGKANDVSGVFSLLLIHLPSVPRDVDMFTPMPNVANFQNGTIRFVDKKPVLSPHQKEDYLINTHPYEYIVGDTSINTELTTMFERIFPNEKERKASVRSIAQMFGGMLFPTRPHFFFFVGKTGTGKSTVMDLARRLVHPDDVCSVEPHEFTGFFMEGMLGKLVNMDTDIDTTKVISDSKLKKVVDRVPYNVRRKNKTDIRAPLPPIHIFGCNSIPKSLEGSHKTYDRRMKIINFSDFNGSGTEVDLDFAQKVWDSNPQGIINFAIAGAIDLLELGGHYSHTEAGKKSMTDWELESDPIGQFISDIEDGEELDGGGQLTLDKEGEMLRSRLWKMFSLWQDGNCNKVSVLPKHQFLKRFGERGFKFKKREDGVKVLGITCQDAGPN